MHTVSSGQFYNDLPIILEGSNADTPILLSCAAIHSFRIITRLQAALVHKDRREHALHQFWTCFVNPLCPAQLCNA
jgi:hypothetical protein